MEEERMGANTGTGSMVTHLVYADNVFLLGNNVRMLRWMQNEITIAIETRGWEWKASSLETMAVVNDGAPITFKSGGTWYHPKPVTEMVCLGAKLDETATTEASVLHRREIAEKTLEPRWCLVQTS